jgi:hypothetical protein
MTTSSRKLRTPAMNADLESLIATHPTDWIAYLDD